MNDYILNSPNLTIYDSLVKSESVLNKYKNIMVSVSGGSDSDNIIDIVENLKNNDSKISYVFF